LYFFICNNLEAWHCRNPTYLLIKNQYKMNQQIEKLWDLIVNYELATEQSLQLVTRLNGYTLETMEDVLYALTGYHSCDQFMENER